MVAIIIYFLNNYLLGLPFCENLIFVVEIRPILQPNVTDRQTDDHNDTY